MTASSFFPLFRRLSMLLPALLVLFAPLDSWAQAMPALTSTPGPNGSQAWSLSSQSLAMLTLMPFLRAALLMKTCFARIIIVLGLLLNAMGTGTAPPNMLLVGRPLFLTFFTMSPVFNEVYAQA